jgi:hypothetical protein
MRNAASYEERRKVDQRITWWASAFLIFNCRNTELKKIGKIGRRME